MNFWHMQLHPNNRDEVGRDEVIKIIADKKIIGLGAEWENDRGQPQKFQNEIKVGDIVLIRSDGPLALVKVVGESTANKKEDVWFKLTREIEVISLEGELFKKEFKKNFKVNWNDSLYLPTAFEGANNSPFIQFWYRTVKEKIVMEDSIALLKYKNQIILQGAPGTGKTYTAELIAQEMTKAKVIESPIEKINDFFRHFKKEGETAERIQKDSELLEEFYSKYPAANLNELSLQDYVLGLGNNDSFCWWIEYGLKDLGIYTGASGKFKIYWSREQERFNKSGFVKNVEDDEQAMEMLAQKIQAVARDKEPEKYIQYLSKGYVLKILSSYNPEKYFPVNSEENIDNILKLVGTRPDNKNLIEKNSLIQQFYLQKKKEFGSDATNLEFMRFLYQNFDIRGDIELTDTEISAKGEYKIIQFHPSYSYEDFVRGITVKTVDNNPVYRTENRILADFAEKACNSDANFVLIIDEINRANLPSVLGELVYGLEYRGKEIETMYALDDSDDETKNRKISLPENLYIIGTMNTADRSVGHIDYAIRRRFAFVGVQPQESVIETARGKDLFRQVAELFVKEYQEGINNPERSAYLAPDFEPLDVMIGHSYFMGPEDKLQMRLDYEIKPILYEYLKDGIFLKAVKEQIEQLSF